MTGSRPKLLTPKDVAELLQISEKTVYKHRRKFCGFNPAGLGVLRFRGEIIKGIMEGQDPKALVLQFPVSGGKLCSKGVYRQAGSRGSQSKTKTRNKTSKDKRTRHGIFRGMQPVS